MKRSAVLEVCPIFMRTLLVACWDDASGVYARLRAASQEENAAHAHASAHSLKGLALMCGAMSLADAAKDMENATRSGGSANFKLLLAQVDAEMELARILLTPYR